MEVDEIIDELNRLKMFEPDEYRRKLAMLKARNPLVYQQVIKIMGIPDVSVKPLAEKPSDPYNVFKEEHKKIRRSNNGLIVAIIGAVLVGFVIIGVIFFFILNLPTSAPTTFSANQSVILGYQLFGTIDELYLQYSTHNNVTSSAPYSLMGGIGRQYIKLNQGDYTNLMLNFHTYCEPDCDYSGESTIPSQKKGGTINFMCSDMSVIEAGKNTISIDALNIYSELNYYVTQGLVISSEREEVWTINGEDCAPMFFDVAPLAELSNNFYDVLSVHYEVCLNNDGVPLAIGKSVISKSKLFDTITENLFVAYLESTDSEILGSTLIGNYTLNQWADTGVAQSCSDFLSAMQGVFEEVQELSSIVENTTTPNYNLYNYSYYGDYVSVYEYTYTQYSLAELDKLKTIRDNCPSVNAYCGANYTEGFGTDTYFNHWEGFSFFNTTTQLYEHYDYSDELQKVMTAKHANDDSAFWALYNIQNS